MRCGVGAPSEDAREPPLGGIVSMRSIARKRKSSTNAAIT